MNVSFARLADGTWGLRFKDQFQKIPEPVVGTTTTVLKKNGSRSVATIGEVVNVLDDGKTVITRIIGKPTGGKFSKATPKKRPEGLPQENLHYVATSVALKEGRPKATRTTLQIKTQEGPVLNIYFDNNSEEQLFEGLFEPEEV